jgi:hypothetical protein
VGVIPDLLESMENLRVVVLIGSTYAWELTDDVREAYHKAHSRDVKILWSPHPGGHGMMDRSPTAKKSTLYGLDHEHNVLWLTIVLEKAKEYVEEGAGAGYVCRRHASVWAF